MVHVNLLPLAHLRRRQHHRRFRIAVFAGALLLGAELIAGIIVHGKAERARELFAAADTARQNIAATRREAEEPKRQAQRLSREVALAERLRTKHRWSRLMASMSEAIPSRVVLSTISTDPPQWPVNILNDLNAGRGSRPILSGVRLTGQAIDHQDLTAFMSAIHASNLFASLDLRQARRERVQERDAILFELECRW